MWGAGVVLGVVISGRSGQESKEPRSCDDPSGSWVVTHTQTHRLLYQFYSVTEKGKKPRCDGG